MPPIDNKVFLMLREWGHFQRLYLEAIGEYPKPTVFVQALEDSAPGDAQSSQFEPVSYEWEQVPESEVPRDHDPEEFRCEFLQQWSTLNRDDVDKRTAEVLVGLDTGSEDMTARRVGKADFLRREAMKDSRSPYDLRHEPDRADDDPRSTKYDYQRHNTKYNRKGRTKGRKV